MSNSVKTHRSFTGHHVLLPASNSAQQHVVIPIVPTRTLLSYTFGRSAVIWRIWPAVLLHTVFAAVVVTITLKTRYNLGIPNVMLTLLGVVIGFVISYRASSGYDRYWQGRSIWSEIMRTSRSFGRLIWFHVPLRLSPKSNNSINTDQSTTTVKERSEEVKQTMAEKRMALDMVEAFSVAVKHHLRGEIGIYYEDLYPLVKPLHDHPHHKHSKSKTQAQVEVQVHEPSPSSSPTDADATQDGPTSTLLPLSLDPSIPPINSYGSLSHTTSSLLHHHPSVSSLSSLTSTSDDGNGEHRCLLPSSRPVQRGVIREVAGDLIPFSSFFGGFARWLVRIKRKLFGGGSGVVDVETAQANGDGGGDELFIESRAQWAHSSRSGPLSDHFGLTHTKHRPRIAGGGENLPLEITRSISHWLSVLDERGSITGNALGGMFGCLSQFEDSLAALERILTTPLPFVFSVHISTVWIYLFFLPCQLVDQFGWYTIPGVGLAAFIYLGFVAAGEEMEQPFGYDENDLDLDMFCSHYQGEKVLINTDVDEVEPQQGSSSSPFTKKPFKVEEAFGHHAL
ncbi:Voltage-dependent anion channel-forming protein YneE/VCCN1/2-like protein [Abortiporus biennis]